MKRSILFVFILLSGVAYKAQDTTACSVNIEDTVRYVNSLSSGVAFVTKRTVRSFCVFSMEHSIQWDPTIYVIQFYGVFCVVSAENSRLSLSSVSHASAGIPNLSPRNSHIVCTPVLLNHSRQVWFCVGVAAAKAAQERIAAFGRCSGSRTDA